MNPAIEFEPLTGCIGARVDGVDLNRDLTDLKHVSYDRPELGRAPIHGSVGVRAETSGVLRILKQVRAGVKP